MASSRIVRHAGYHLGDYSYFNAAHMSKSKHFKVQKKVLNLQPGADCTCTHVHHSQLMLLLLLLLMWLVLQEFLPPLPLLLLMPLWGCNCSCCGLLNEVSVNTNANKWEERIKRKVKGVANQQRTSIKLGDRSSTPLRNYAHQWLSISTSTPRRDKWGQCSRLALPLLFSFNNINAH